MAGKPTGGTGNSKLPTLGVIQIPQPADNPAPITTPVEDANGEVLPSQTQAQSGQPVPARDLFDKASGILELAICGPLSAGPGAAAGADSGKSPGPGPQSPTSPTGVQPNIIWAVRVLIQLILLFFRTPTNIKMLNHTNNADTDLVPAVDNILNYSAAIFDFDPRIQRKVDLVEVGAQKQLLLQLREVLKVLNVAAYCVEAGITHVEQYLDATARWVYGKLVDAIGEDTLLQQDLDKLVRLVTAPIQASQDTKKNNARVQADTLAKAAEEQAAATTTGNSATTPATGQGTTAPGAGQGTTQPAPVAQAVPPVAAHKATTHHAKAGAAAPRKSTARSLRKMTR